MPPKASARKKAAAGTSNTDATNTPATASPDPPAARDDPLDEEEENEEGIAEEEARFDQWRVAISKYEVLRPRFTPENKVGITMCMKADEANNPTGFYRFAISGTEPLRVKINLQQLIGMNPLPDTTFEVSIRPNDIRFQENCMHTRWFSFLDCVRERRVIVNQEGMEMAAAIEHALRVLKDVKISLRWDIEIPRDSSSGIGIVLRGLPREADHLNDDARLSKQDVAAVTLHRETAMMNPFPAELQHMCDNYNND